MLKKILEMHTEYWYGNLLECGHLDDYEDIWLTWTLQTIHSEITL